MRKRRLISLALVLAMVLTLFPVPALAAQRNAFTDVNAEDWYYDAVTYVRDRDLMSGTGSGAFSPQDTTTRSMIVTILYRMENEPTVFGTAFTDVPSGQWYTKAVAWASQKEIVLGYGDGTFGPNDTITREQLATILYRYSKYKGYSVRAIGALYEFPDQNKISDFALSAMSWAVGAGLISGTGDHTLSPDGNASRAQVAAVLMRYCKNIATGNSQTSGGGGGGSTGGGGGGGAVTRYYTVSFDTLASDVTGTPANQKVRSGNKVNRPDDPTRPTYQFTGWYQDESLQTVYDFSAPVTRDLTLYAGWAAEGFEGKFRITFDLNNGDAGVYEMQEVAPGGEATVPAVAPERELYRFTGWYTEPETAFLYDFNSAVHSDVTLYAGWGDPDGGAGLYSASNTEETVYSITGLEMAEDGSSVNVTLNTNRACGLVVDFFTDEMGENFSQTAMDANLSGTPLASVGIQTPKYGELIVVSIPMEETLPERYLARARLVALSDTDDVIDLCAPYVDITHTEQFAKFDAQTTADFEPERVVNFDQDTTTNFGVLQDYVVRVISTPTANTLSVADIPVEGEIVPDHTYTFANPDATVSALKAGDVVYVEDTQYLFKIKTATREPDGSVTFTPDGDADITEYYAMVKVDMGPAEQEPQEQGQAETMSLIEAEGKGEVSLSTTITWEPRDWLNLTGSVEGSVSLDFSLYYDPVFFGEDYVSCSLIVEAKAEFKATLKVTSDDIPLGDEIKLLDVPIPIPCIPGVEAYIEASIPVTLKLSASLTATVTISAKSGFRYDSNSGREDIKDSEVKVALKAEGKAELKTGFKFAVGVRLLKKVMKAEVGIEAGVKVTLTVVLDSVESNATKKHTCTLCIDGEAKYYYEVTAKLSFDIGFLKGDAFKLTLLSAEAWIKFLPSRPGKFYISIVHGEDSVFEGDHIVFGGGTCPNIAYRTEFAAENEAGEALSGVSIQVTKNPSGFNETVQSPGTLFLHDGTYTVSANIDGTPVRKTLVVKGERQSVHLSKNSGDTVLSGKVVNSENTSQAMEDVSVKISQNGVVVTSAKTKRDGAFSVPVPAGTVLVEVTKEGFIPFSVYQRVEGDQAMTPMETIELIAGSGVGGMRGVITDAVTGECLPDVELEVRAGWDNTTEGDVVKRMTTNEYGEFKANTVSLLGGRLILGLPCGNYTVRASKSGYIGTGFNVVVRPGETDDYPNQDAAMAPVPTQGGEVSGDTYRIVLTWGENPSDLDSHMVGNRSDDRPFHVYYGDKSSHDGNLEVCNLDLDDITSFGPETIMLNANTSDPYYYYIHLFAGSGTLPTSGAQIKVYHGADVVRTFHVPSTVDSNDRYWNVFAIVNGRIVVNNTITSEPNLQYAGPVSGSAGNGGGSAFMLGEFLTMPEKK